MYGEYSEVVVAADGSFLVLVCVVISLPLARGPYKIRLKLKNEIIPQNKKKISTNK